MKLASRLSKSSNMYQMEQATTVTWFRCWPTRPLVPQKCKNSKVRERKETTVC